MRFLRFGIVFMPALLAFAWPAPAKVILQPDAQTLWIEDGQGIEAAAGLAAGHWNSDTMTFEDVPEGGLKLVPSDEPRRTSTGRELPLSIEYPYVELEVASVSPQPRGNRGFAPPRPVGTGAAGMVMGTDVQTGRWVYRVFGDGPAPRAYPARAPWRVDVYGNDVTVGYIKAVKLPDYRIEIDSPTLGEKNAIDLGDTITLRVVMKEEAEDVSLSFFDSYRMRPASLNGQQRLQLKPAGDDAKVWQATFALESAAGDEKAGRLFQPGKLVIKATILGGGLKVPLWSTNYQDWRVRPQAPAK